MTAGYYDIQRGMRVLFAALLVFAFVTPVCVTMACSMVGMAPTSANVAHMDGMVHAGTAAAAATTGSAAATTATNGHAAHTSLGDCMRGFTSHSGLVGTDSLTLAAILVALALMGLASATAPLAAVSANAWATPLRAPSPPPPLSPLGVRLSV